MAGVCVDKDYSSKRYFHNAYRNFACLSQKNGFISFTPHASLDRQFTLYVMTSGNNDMCLTSWEKYALETTGFVSLPTKSMTEITSYHVLKF